MENLKINKKSEQTTATYTKGGYRVEITYNVDKTGGNIESINMSIYGDPNGNYLGNANASYNGSELTYNISREAIEPLSDYVIDDYRGFSFADLQRIVENAK
jgi:hypothetical protein